MKIAAFLGDGIGPEIVSTSLDILTFLDDIFRLGLQIEVLPSGFAALNEHHVTFPAQSRTAAAEADGIVLGPLATSQYPSREEGGLNASALLRRELDLFANVRPCRAYGGITAKAPNMDLIVVRENTEGFYAARAMHAGTGEFSSDADTAFALRRITARCSHRIADVAFSIARDRRRKVTAVHKANVLPITDGIFLRECRAVAKANADIGYEELLVDAAASRLVVDEKSFDVLVTTNLFGDVLSNEAAGLCGGLGLGASLNYGERHAMAQASHGAALDIAGSNIANPLSMLLSIALLLRHLGVQRELSRFGVAADALEECAVATLSHKDTRTPDVAGAATTRKVKDAVMANLEDVLAGVSKRGVV